VYVADPFGRITSETTQIDGKSFRVRYEYDITGRLTAITGPSGRRRASTYNAVGELVRMPGLIDTDIVYDKAGRPTQAALSNRITRKWRYDMNGRLVNKSDTGAAPIQSWALSYDKNDNIVGLNDRIYTFDALDRITYERRRERTLEQQSVDRGVIRSDVRGEATFADFPLTNAMVKLDYNAGSLGLDLKGRLTISEIHLLPDSPAHRVDRYGLRIFSSGDNTADSYTEETH